MFNPPITKREDNENRLAKVNPPIVKEEKIINIDR